MINSIFFSAIIKSPSLRIDMLNIHYFWNYKLFLDLEQVRGSIPSGVVKFNLKIFNLGARRGGDVHFLIARLYITMPGLNSKHFRSMYVEKAYSTVDSDSSVGWGC